MPVVPVDRSSSEVRSFREREEELQDRIENLRNARCEYIRKHTKEVSQEHPEYPGSFWIRCPGRRDPEDFFRREDPDVADVKTEVYREVLETDHFRNLAQQSQEAQAELDELLDEALDQFGPVDENATKRDQIAVLFAVFDRAVDATRVADVVGCSVQHVRRFTYEPETGETRYKDWERKRKQNQVAESQYDRIRERDDDRCVRCGTKEKNGSAEDSEERTLLVHHIIPVADGGSGDDRNLALLCPQCHELAHAERGAGAVIYDTISQFWRWAGAGPEAGENYDPKQTQLSEYY